MRCFARPREAAKVLVPFIVSLVVASVLVQIAVFEVSQLKGFLRVVGTKASAGGVLVSYTVVGIKKYAA